MTRILYALSMSLLVSLAARSQTFSFSGVVIAEDDRSPLAGASVQVGNHTQTTDIDGQFSLTTLPDSVCSITVSRLGYHAVTYDSINISGAPHTIFLLQPTDFCEGIEERARLDLAHGKVYLYFGGLEAVPAGSYLSKRLELEHKYGFEPVEGGCTEICAGKYNAIVRIYLDRRNGPGWWERYCQELEALNK